MKTTKTSEIVTRVANRKSTSAKKSSKRKVITWVKDIDQYYSDYNGFGSGDGEVYFGGHYYYVA